MDYTENAVSPRIHRLWCGISLVGGACERRIWTITGDRTSFPSLYILLVAPPGTGKSIINTVKALWREAKEPTGGDAFHVASDSLTRAALVDELDDSTSTRLYKFGTYVYHTLLIGAEEFEVLLPFYDPNFISLFNDLWNVKSEHIEKRRHGPAKVVTIKNPQIHMLGGAQPSYFVAHFPEEAWTTGLARRTIMIYADSAPLKDPFEKTPNLNMLKDKILKRLGFISDVYGEVKVGAAARRIMTDWHMSGRAPEPNHSKLAAYNTTRFEFLVKLSLISSVSRSLDMIIEEFDVKRAMEWLLEAEKFMPDIFRAMIGRSDTQVLEELHRFVYASWNRDKSPVRTPRIIEFLSARLPSEKVDRTFQVAQGAGIIARAANTVDSWIPRPKFFMNGE